MSYEGDLNSASALTRPLSRERVFCAQRLGHTPHREAHLHASSLRTMKTPILCILLASASLMSSCSNSPNARTGTVIGALGGAGVGGIIGSQSGRGLEGALIGGGLGALGGNLIGGSQDQNRYDDRYYNNNRRRR
jgi:hypothetical protein